MPLVRRLPMLGLRNKNTVKQMYMDINIYRYNIKYTLNGLIPTNLFVFEIAMSLFNVTVSVYRPIIVPMLAMVVVSHAVMSLPK